MWLFMKCKETERERQSVRQGQGDINKETERENGKRTKKKSVNMIFLLGAMVGIKVTKENDTEKKREREKDKYIEREIERERERERDVEKERDRERERQNARESQKKRNKKKNMTFLLGSKVDIKLTNKNIYVFASFQNKMQFFQKLC